MPPHSPTNAPNGGFAGDVVSPCATRSICPTRGRFGRLLRVNQIWFTFSVLIQDSESVLIHFGGPRAYFAQSLRIGLIIGSLLFCVISSFCVPHLNTLSREKKEPGGPYRFGKVLRALYILSLFYPGVRVHFPRKSWCKFNKNQIIRILALITRSCK